MILVQSGKGKIKIDEKNLKVLKEKIVEWSKQYARQIGKRYVRLDTLGNNTKLIAHYTSVGFDFLGMVKLTDTVNLPAHYQKEPNCCLFEIDLQRGDL